MCVGVVVTVHVAVCEYAGTTLVILATLYYRSVLLSNYRTVAVLFLMHQSRTK